MLRQYRGQPVLISFPRIVKEYMQQCDFSLHQAARPNERT